MDIHYLSPRNLADPTIPADAVINREGEDIRKHHSRGKIITQIHGQRLTRTIPMPPDELPGGTKLLLYLYGEELEIRIGVSSIESMAAKIHVKLGARW
jgi:hypothetical protein